MICTLTVKVSQNVIDIKKYTPIIDAAVEASIENRIVG
jgi:hypothetical protein